MSSILTLGCTAHPCQPEPSTSGPTMAKLSSRDARNETTKCWATTTCAVTGEAGSSGPKVSRRKTKKASRPSNANRGIISKKDVVSKARRSLTWASTARWTLLAIIFCKRMAKSRFPKEPLELLTKRRKRKREISKIFSGPIA